MIDIFVASIIFVIPAYAANGIPTLVGGGAPIDGGRVFSRDSRRLLGDGKTWRGFYGGMVAGILLGTAEFLSEPIFRPLLVEFFPNHSFSWVGDIRIIICAFLLSFGALLGDMIGSFFKNWLKSLQKKRGMPEETFNQKRCFVPKKRSGSEQ